MKLILVLLSLTTAALAAKSRFDNYQVLRVFVSNQAQFEAVVELEKMGYLYMDPPSSPTAPVDLIVPPHKNAEIEEILANFHIQSELIHPNFQQLIDSEGEYRGRATNNIEWTKYYQLEDIYGWLDQIIARYPGVVTGFSIGDTYEGRPIRGVKISYRSGNEGIFLESNLHAREWITSATATWIINELLTSTDPKVRNIAETVDWWIVPVANPDGFVYSHTRDRQWRKNRAPSSAFCIGTDPNRNFGHHYRTGGTSNDPCSLTYHGNEAFSELESRHIRDFYAGIEKNVTAYLDFHSYSQLLMYPYGSPAAGRASNEEEHKIVGKAMAEAISRRYGTKYEVGDIATTIYVCSGTSLDWAKGIHDTPFVWIYELRDTGRNGFVLPADQIIPNSEETFDSFVVFVEEARKLGYFKQ